MAGHETTATTLLWAVKLLADNQEKQTELRRALESNHKVSLSENRNPSAHEIAHTAIPYLDATMEEILRLSPPLSLLSRENDVDTVVLGHRIPKNTNVIMHNKGPSFFEPSLHIDESLRSSASQAAAKEHGVREWSPDGMDQYRPERWLVPSGSNDRLEFDATAGPTITFGLGVRGCYGRRLGYLELRILLTLVVWNFELLPCPEELSSYGGLDGLTHKPLQAYARLKQRR